MSDEDRITDRDVLSTRAWPWREWIGENLIAGRNADGQLCIAECGPLDDVQNSVLLDPDEITSLVTFLNESGGP